MSVDTSIRLLVRLRCLHEDCSNYLTTAFARGRYETGKIFLDNDCDLLCWECDREMELEV